MHYANQYLNNWEKLFDGFVPRTEWQPVFSADENQNQYAIHVEMPGVPQDQIKLEVVENTIHISGERKNFGSFQRSLTLPTAANTQLIEASYDDGVLKIVIPKHEAAKPRQIKIGSRIKENEAETKLVN